MMKKIKHTKGQTMKTQIFMAILVLAGVSFAFGDIVENTNKPAGQSTDLKELMSEDSALMKGEQNANSNANSSNANSVNLNAISNVNSSENNAMNFNAQNTTKSSAEPANSLVLKGFVPKNLGQISGLANGSLNSSDFIALNASNLTEAIRREKGVFMRDAIGGDAISNAYIRGFGRERIGLFIDGIPLNDYDAGRNDYELVLLNGFGGLEIYKGYISPSHAQNFGAINLTSYTPQKELEARLTADTTFNAVGRNGLRTQKGVFVGTNGGTYFLSVDYSDSERDAFAFSQGYDGTFMAMEGYQVNSKLNNTSLKLRAGFTPNENNEYSLNFYYQKGSKGDMTKDPTYVNYNTLPVDMWNSLQKQMLYLLGHSNFTDSLSLDTRLYYQAFDSSMTNVSVFRNYSQYEYAAIQDYNDDAYGALMSLNYAFTQAQKMKFGFHLKRDSYKNYNARVDRPMSKLINVDVSELKSSVFGEYDGAFGDLHLLVGASYERSDIAKARNYNTANKGGNQQPQAQITKSNTDKINPKGDFSAQLALLYEFNGANTAHLSVGKRLNFPTLHQRYFETFYMTNNAGAPATTMGVGTMYRYDFNYEINPNLRPESVLSYELGYDLTLPSTHLSVAGFYNDLYDSFIIKQTGVNATSNSPIYKLTNGYGGQSWGGEVSVEQGFFADNALIIGANYSYIYNKQRADDKSTPEFRHHNHIANAKIQVSPIKTLNLTALGTYQSKPVVNSSAQWLKGKDYLSVDLMARFYVAKGFSLKGGVLNISDRDNAISYYTATNGVQEYHLAGRRYMIGFDYNYGQ